VSLFGKRKMVGPLEIGLCRGNRPGHLGAWAKFSTETSPTEIYQVRFSAQSRTGAVTLPPWSYTFTPAHDTPFFHSLETPLAFKEFLTGARHVTEGKVTVDFLASGERTITQTYDVDEILKLYRGKGLTPPEGVRVAPRYLEVDKPYAGNLGFPDLKARSDKARAEIEAERQRREAEAKAAKEAAEKKAAEEAAKKAAAAKAASGAPAAAAKPGGPTISGGKCALFFGSTTNNTADIAAMLKEELGSSIDHVVNVASCSPQDFQVCEVMILGVPTWHIGEMQDDWAGILPQLKEGNYAGKKIAIFGLGDQKGYPDTYVDAMGELLEIFEPKGAKLFGLWPTAGYDFKKSKAIRDGKFLGLVIDIENQSDKTPARVKAWADQLRKELGL
jgi:flavodoxin I